MSLIFDLNDESNSLDIFVANDEGQPTTGLVAATFPDVYYSIAGANADVQIVLADLATITTAWASGGLKERGNGIYRLDVPNAAYTTLDSKVTIRGGSAGKWIIPVTFEVSPQLTNTTVGTVSVIGSGTGPYQVTITAKNVDEDTLTGAVMTLQLNGVPAASGTSNASGVSILNVPATGTYRLVGALTGHSYGGQDVVVDGNETVTATFTAITITPPASPEFCTLAIRVWGTNGAVAVGVVVKVKVSVPPTGEGELFSNATVSDATGADGYATFTVPRGCSLRYWIGSSEKNLNAVGSEDDVVYVDNWLGS